MKGFLKGLLFFLVPLLVVYLVLKTTTLQTVKIPSDSMSPSLRAGDVVLVNKAIFGVKVFGYSIWEGFEPKVGEIVVFSGMSDEGGSFEEKKLFIKRVVGGPGDFVQVIKDRVLIGGEYLYEKGYIQIVDPFRTNRRAEPEFGPIDLGESEYFLLGDNRSNSIDSRVFGPVKRENIIGRAELVVSAEELGPDGESRGLRWVR